MRGFLAIKTVAFGYVQPYGQASKPWSPGKEGVHESPDRREEYAL